MTSIRLSAAMQQLSRAQQQLEELIAEAGGKPLKKSELEKADPLLYRLANDRRVTTGCSKKAQQFASPTKMRKALELIGAQLRHADRDGDGHIRFNELGGLEAVALTLLDRAARGLPKVDSARRALTAARKNLDDLAAAGTGTRVKVEELKSVDPFLAAVATDRTVMTGCSASSRASVSVRKMHQALNRIEAAIERVDASGNQDGRIQPSETRHMSSLALQLLAKAGRR